MSFIKLILAAPLLGFLLCMAVCVFAIAFVCWFIDSMCAICLNAIHSTAVALGYLIKTPIRHRRKTILRGKDDPPSEDL